MDTKELKILKAIASLTNNEIAEELDCCKTLVTRAINTPDRYPGKAQEIQYLLWHKALGDKSAIALLQKIKESERISQIA